MLDGGVSLSPSPSPASGGDGSAAAAAAPAADKGSARQVEDTKSSKQLAPKFKK